MVSSGRYRQRQQGALTRCGASSSAFGLSIGVPSVGTSPGLAGKRWGGIGGAVVGVTLSAVGVEAMKDYVRAHRVPWPNADSTTARKHRKTAYNLYQIWMTRKKTGNKDLFKYGITRLALGKGRPQSQIGTCNRNAAVVKDSCHWRWVRVHIAGWYRARGWEATYCARYVARKNHRPLGMKRCV
ncbi:hypothetical protein NOCA240031 [metagenome]|uniref:Uncharacterized protein n=1 Tax=metagenome TaxID=256318 RepID=A0A2P2C5I7_9ZZZZ